MKNYKVTATIASLAIANEVKQTQEQQSSIGVEIASLRSQCQTVLAMPEYFYE